MITKRTQTTGIIGGVVLLVAVAVLAALIFLVFKEQEAVQAQAQARAAAEDRSLQLASLGELVVETEASRTRLESYVVTEEEVIDFLALVEAAGREQGLTVTTRSLDVQPISGNKTFEWLTLTVEVSGSFEGVARMASLIESLPFQIMIDRVVIDRAAAGTGQVWRGTFDIRVTKFIAS